MSKISILENKMVRNSEKKDLKVKVPRFKAEGGFYTSEKNSKIMRRIKSKNTKPEIYFRKALWNAGVRYRLSNTCIPGKPDLSFKKIKLVIFIDGDFWHGYNWEQKKYRITNNSGYWIPKIERNIQRDLEVNMILANEGWTVLRFWEHEILKNTISCIEKVIATINRCKYNNQC